MRGTLIGSDYLKQGNEVKFLEINTNIGIHPEGINHLETGSLMALLTGSNITEFHFIHSGNDSNGKKDTNPEYKFAISLSSSLAKHNISYHDYEVAEGAITVPYIEDSDDKFILRQSYDNTAIIDSSYAADNFEFFDLMNGSNYSPKLYMSSSIDDIDIDTLDVIATGSTHPNIVIKSRYPSYDHEIYPKLYKYTDTSSIAQDLIDLKTNCEEDYLIQEFVNDDSNITDGRWSVIRGVDILYGDNLDILHLGGYKTTSFLDLNAWSTTFSGSSTVLDKKSKMKYNSKAMITDQNIYHTDLESRMLKTDGTLVSGSQLSLGDGIKAAAFELEVGTIISASVPVFPEDDNFLDHYGYVSDITGSIQYVTSSVANIEEKLNDAPVVSITFSDGDITTESPRAQHLIEESGSNLTYFESVNQYMVGDKLLLLDINTNTISKKEITNLTVSWGNPLENVYNIDVEPADQFLVKYSGSNFTITHNICTYCYAPWAPCGNYYCDTFCANCDGPGGFK